MKIKKIFAFTVTVCCMVCLCAQTSDDSVYVFRQDFAHLYVFLPAPPDTDDVQFMDDLIQYQWGRTQRETERGKQADRESSWKPDIIRILMAQVLELDTISDESTPALSRLLLKSYRTGDLAISQAKEDHWRTRPFVRMNDPLWATFDTDYLRTNSSYPSGHTSFAWFTALVFAEMWPELQDTILRRGFEFGENRVITGAHWQSDVTAGYLCAAAAVARAHTNPELEKDIMAARSEYAVLKGLPANYNPATKADIPHGERIMNDPVDTASNRYLGDLEKYWDAKSLRNTPRGEQAVIEAEFSVKMMQQIFSEAVSITLSNQTTPAITSLLNRVQRKSSETTNRLKTIYFRKRPFVQLNEPSMVPSSESSSRTKSSFPSGHTNLGWATALVLAEVAPECQDQILKRGYEYGYSRIIVGYHWASDVEATRQLASALVARLHADPQFRELIDKAREEYIQVSRANK